MSNLHDHKINVLIPYLVPDKEMDADGSVMFFRAATSELAISKFNNIAVLNGEKGHISECTWMRLASLYNNYDKGEKSMLWNADNQKCRKTCLTAIKSKYNDDVGLRAERRQGKCYYAVWGSGRMVLETVLENGVVRIYEYRAAT